MSKAPLVAFGASLLAAAVSPAFASSPGAQSGTFTVRVRVVSSCGVRVDASGAADIRCTRGAADRVLVDSAKPRVVTLERDGSKLMTAQVETGAPTSGAERVVTLQF
ncbi:MAG TPA: hypothetical protein VNK41_07640 [Vicinamibacterales bacterium]|nr:hypothetical protein [Vicinamibacterales bacterium]